MKKILFLAFIFASISFSVSAQQQRQNAPKTFDNRNGMKHEKAGQLKDLNLTDAQKAELKKSNEALKAKMQALRSQDITPEERQKQMEAIKSERQANLDKILTPEQKATLEKKKAEKKEEKMEERREKAEKMKSELDLTDEQSAKMKANAAANKEKIQAIRNNSTLTEDQKKAQIKEILKSTKQENKEILTPEQQKKMKEMHKKREGKRRANNIKPVSQN